MWEFIDGGPKDNETHFCPRCGGVLLAEPFAEDETPNAHSAASPHFRHQDMVALEEEQEREALEREREADAYRLANLDPTA